MAARSTNRIDRHAEAITHVTTEKAQLPTDMQYAMDLAQEKGALSWLSVLLIQKHKLTLHKGTFRDAFALQYGR